MFLEDAFLENAKSDLQALIAQHQISTDDTPFPWDPYIAKSLLQKSIRRGDIRNALWASRVLLRSNERGFWKRLCIIALEDIGVANVRLVAQILLVEKDRSLRKQLGGSQETGPSLTSALCCSPKDRCTDDLIDAIGSLAKNNCLKAKYAELSTDELLEVVSSPTTSIQSRAIAAVQLSTWFGDLSVGISTNQGWLKTLQLLPEDVLSPCYKVTATMGMKRTGSIMAPYLALVSRDTPINPDYVDDEFPTSADLSGLPSWTLDGHTRLGLQSFRIYLKRSVSMAAFLEKWATREVSLSRTVAGLVFRIESAQLARKMVWTTGRKLKSEACANRPGLPTEAASEGLSIIREELDLVNECREAAVRLYLR